MLAARVGTSCSSSSGPLEAPTDPQGLAGTSSTRTRGLGGGAASGGGAGRAGIGQIEALMGIVPGGGGTQYLAGRIGRNRALEAVLGADLHDAETAERYGWVNRAVPADELDDVVDRLARNIAALPEGVVAAAKRAILPDDLSEGFRREHDAWAGQVVRPAAERLIRGGLAHGAQTRDGERDLEGLLRGLAGR